MARASAHEVPEKVREYLNLPNDDKGIDLIAAGVNGEYTAIQAKYRENKDETFTWNQLATFTSSALLICKNISQGIVRTSTDKPIASLSWASPDQIRFEGLEQSQILDDENGLGWKNIHQYIASPETPIIPKIKTPRPYQDEAIKAAVNHFKDNENSRGRLIMP